MLEWFQTTRVDAIIPGLIMVLVAIGYLTWRDWGFGWMSTWWLWLIVLVGLPIFYFAIGGHHMSAGADWLNSRGSFVKTYELTSIKVSTGGGGSYYLNLEDGQGNEVSIQLGVIQQNRALWDLVYNGILHSVHR
ncbi:MAG: hypothetical protein LC808_35420, partial [Actinobacteria bacterium]|nr:hypothetical protein [Actinomycetota bacterium]